MKLFYEERDVPNNFVSGFESQNRSKVSNFSFYFLPSDDMNKVGLMKSAKKEK